MYLLSHIEIQKKKYLFLIIYVINKSKVLLLYV